MLNCTIEIWPYGDKSAAKRLVTISIVNLGDSYCPEGYDYAWTIDEPNPLSDLVPIKAQGVLRSYDRKNYCVHILAEVLKDFYAGNGVKEEDMTQFMREVTTRIRLKN